jgi:hypothetical protein
MPSNERANYFVFAYIANGFVVAFRSPWSWVQLGPVYLFGIREYTLLLIEELT